MKDCSEINYLISMYIDDELDMNERTEFEEHISVCELCRKEFEEVKKVVELCRDISEEELPENFKQQLHEKLLIATQDIEGTAGKKAKFLWKLPGKYIKICSSIAAVFLIAVLIKVLFPISSMYDESTSQSAPKENAVTMQGGSGTDGKAEKAAADNKYGQSVQEEAKADVSKEIIMNYSAQDQYMDDTSNGKKAEPRSTARGAGAKAKIAGKNDSASSSDNDKTDSGNKETQICALTVVGNNLVRDISITVKSKAPDTDIETIRTKAIELGAEFREVKALVVPDSENTEATTADKTASKKLTFRIEGIQYDAFIEKLNECMGPEFVNVGEMHSLDAAAKLSTMENKLKELDKKISKLPGTGDNSDSEELKKLKAERESTQAEIDRLKDDIKHISISIEIIKR